MGLRMEFLGRGPLDLGEDGTVRPADSTAPPGVAACSTCPFWAKDEKVSAALKLQHGHALAVGECRRRDPRRLDSGPGFWPRTQSSDWCGEHPALSPERTRLG